MSEVPPPFAEYPRPVEFVGTVDQLRALIKGHADLNRAMLATLGFGAVLVGVGVVVALGGNNADLVFGIGVPVLLVAVGFLAHPGVKGIGEGMSWSRTQVLAGTLLIPLGLLCLPTYGILGYAVVQHIALSRIKRYGVKRPPFGSWKKAMEARLDELAGDSHVHTRT